MGAEVIGAYEGAIFQFEVAVQQVRIAASLEFQSKELHLRATFTS
jgi:hypothetical protein